MKTHVIDYIKQHDLLAATLDIEPVDCAPGYGKAIMPLGPKHLNAAGVAHGGALFCLADIALALAANSYGHLALGLHADISFFKPGKVGPLTAEARETSHASKVSHFEITITDGQGEIIASSTAIAYRKSTPFP